MIQGYEVPPPDPAKSTPHQRNRYMRDRTVLYSRELAIEDLLDPPKPETPLPELPDAGDPMPEHLATFWDGLTDLERLLINGGKGWRQPLGDQWPRIHVCVDIFRAHGLSFKDAIAMCRFTDGLGGHMPDHAEILRTIWRMGEPDYTGPRNHRQVEHMEAVFGFGLLCEAPANEISLCAKATWQEAQAFALNFFGTLRQRLWPLCRTLAPEQAVIAAADAVMEQFNVFVPDALLMPVLANIENGAKPRPQRRRRLA